MIVADEQPNQPAIGLCAGIDWAKDDHAVCIVGPGGEALHRFMIKHDRAGLKDMIRRLLRAGVTEVGIERPDGPIVDALLQAELTVLVISPNQVKNLRSRYGSAGNKDDRFDAYVLADVVRTDRRRLRPLQPDKPANVTLRTAVRARRDLVAHRVAVANQLRAHLQIVFPAAATLFADIDSGISLRFLDRFNTQALALSSAVVQENCAPFWREPHAIWSGTNACARFRCKTAIAGNALRTCGCSLAHHSPVVSVDRLVHRHHLSNR